MEVALLVFVFGNLACFVYYSDEVWWLMEANEMSE